MIEELQDEIGTVIDELQDKKEPMINELQDKLGTSGKQKVPYGNFICCVYVFRYVYDCYCD